MELEIRKYRLIQWLIGLEEEEVMEEVEKMRDRYAPSDPDWWDQLSKSQRRGLAIGLQSLENGDSYSYAEVRQGVKEKFGI